MSSYTAFAFHIKVKPEYINVVDDMLKVFEEHYAYEDPIIHEYNNYPYTKEYCSLQRADRIPFGFMDTYIDDVKYSDGTSIDHNKNSWNKETGEWEVGCAVNYGYEEIDYYKHKILSEITKVCYYIYEQHEDHNSYKQYNIDNGRCFLRKDYEDDPW